MQDSSITLTLPTTASALEAPANSFNKANQITDLSSPNNVVEPDYDLNGNMIDLPKPGAWTTECAVTWDAWNRPATFNDGTLTTYRYDALHRRIAKTTGYDDPRHFFFDNQWRPIEERVDDAVKTHFAWSPFDRWSLIRRKRTVTTPLDETLFLLKDYLDPAAIINTSGAVLERFAFDAFGPHRFLDPDFDPSGGDFAWNFLFHAEFLDPESGLYNYGFRYYHPDLGRWLSRDPIAEYGDSNLYQCVKNNCINAWDFLGLQQFNCDPCEDQCNLCFPNVEDRQKCEEDCRAAKLKMNCDKEEEDGKAQDGGGGGRGRCRDPRGFWFCIANVGANLALDLTPGLGELKGVSGGKIQLFGADGSWSPDYSFGGPDIAGAAVDSASFGTKRAFKAKGGDAKLSHYDSIANRSGLGKGARHARSTLSVLKAFSRALPVVGHAMDAFEAAKGAVQCHDTFCK